MKFIVAGTGPSVEGWTPPPGYTTIGVHDIGQHFTPDHLLVFDHKRKFTPERFRIIEATDPHDTLWTRNIAISGLGGSDWTQLKDNPKRKSFVGRSYHTVSETIEALRTKEMILPHYRSSAYTACSLAYKLGATWIGLIGVDLTGHYTLMRHAPDVNKGFARLREALSNLGTILVNLSKESMLTSIPYEELS